MAKTKTELPHERNADVLIALMESPAPLPAKELGNADAALKEMETAGMVKAVKGHWELTPAFRVLAKRAGQGSPSKWAEIRDHQ